MAKKIPPSTMNGLLWAFVFINLGAFVVLGVLLGTGHNDPTTIGILVAFMTPAVTGLLSLLVATSNNSRLSDVEYKVNGRLDRFLQEANKGDYAPGAANEPLDKAEIKEKTHET